MMHLLQIGSDRYYNSSRYIECKIAFELALSPTSFVVRLFGVEIGVKSCEEYKEVI